MVSTPFERWWAMSMPISLSASTACGLTRRRRPGAHDVDSLAEQRTGEAFRHLTARGIGDAQEENAHGYLRNRSDVPTWQLTATSADDALLRRGTRELYVSQVPRRRRAPNNVEAQQFGPSVPRECGRVVEMACGPNQTAAGEVVNDASEKG